VPHTLLISSSIIHLYHHYIHPPTHSLTLTHTHTHTHTRTHARARAHTHAHQCSAMSVMCWHMQVQFRISWQISHYYLKKIWHFSKIIEASNDITLFTKTS
jgi:hypothetical protein